VELDFNSLQFDSNKMVLFGFIGSLFGGYWIFGHLTSRQLRWLCKHTNHKARYKRTCARNAKYSIYWSF